ncbi:MAG: DUF5615 family PIN-like protein [Actinomycetia bacterium]|nr:DUF5615 family PIN-like protein [Actinomycetes bacterium]
MNSTDARDPLPSRACRRLAPRASVALLLDEHFADAIAERLRAEGHDVIALVTDPTLRAEPDSEVFRRAALAGRLLVTENIKDFRPLLLRAYERDEPIAQLLLVPAKRSQPGGRRTPTMVRALRAWLTSPEAGARPDEDWLTQL